MGYGVVVRDHHGYVRAACSVPQTGLLSSAAAEARAALMAVLLCTEMGFSWIHLEGDAKGVIEVVKSAATNYSKVGHLVEDLKVSLWNFLQWKMDFVRKGSNYAANCLGKLAMRNTVERTW